eukprot:scaffold5471_cov212-Alexandrium_tamarense.AAC.8
MPSVTSCLPLGDSPRQVTCNFEPRGRSIGDVLHRGWHGCVSSPSCAPSNTITPSQELNDDCH